MYDFNEKLFYTDLFIDKCTIILHGFDIRKKIIMEIIDE